ncbi:Uncharacterised protein [Actinomyces viscosus]|uniref:Uncharacterized protein n=1 Tax=Actinomyces viscosus TaxID=1656 RepID=A0A3S5EWG3_ACTVI|nr:Uncharacterised protein [Actinomyces viscosus]
MPCSATKRMMSARVKSSAGLPRAWTKGFGLSATVSVDSAAEGTGVCSDGMEAPLGKGGRVAAAAGSHDDDVGPAAGRP